MVRHDITPSVELTQVLEARRIPLIRRRQIQAEAESLEVFPQVLEIGVAMVESAIGRELALDEGLKRGAHPAGDGQSGLYMKVTAEPLEMGTEQDDIRARILLAEARVGRGECPSAGLLDLDFAQSRQALIPPVLQSEGSEALQAFIERVGELTERVRGNGQATRLSLVGLLFMILGDDLTDLRKWIAEYRVDLGPDYSIRLIG